MVNVLITAIGGDIAQGVLKSLQLSRSSLRLIGSDISPYAAGLFLVKRGYVVAPARKKTQYLEDIIKICRTEKIDIVFACNEEEKYLIAANLKKLQTQTKAFFVVQPLSVLTICQDKFKLYQFLTKNKIATPASSASLAGAKKLIRQFGFPIIIKSRHGYGSHHFHFINNFSELSWYGRQAKRPIFQQYIGSPETEEYTVGVFLSHQNKALGQISMLRHLRGGFTAYAWVDHYPDVAALAVLAAEAVGAVGPGNVQLRRDHRGKLWVIEINARISGTAIFRSLFGFNEALSAISYFLQGKKPRLKYRRGFVVRIWSELIVSPRRFQQLSRKKKIANY